MVYDVVYCIYKGELNFGYVTKDERSISHGEKVRSNAHGDIVAHAQCVVLWHIRQVLCSLRWWQSCLLVSVCVCMCVCECACLPCMFASDVFTMASMKLRLIQRISNLVHIFMNRYAWCTCALLWTCILYMI